MEQGRANVERHLPVRLTPEEIVGLRAVFEQVLAPLGGVRVYVFGSRAQLDQKGGDIDLLIACHQRPTEALTQLARRLRLLIEDQLGEQKVDIVWDVPDQDSALVRLAKEQGVMIWQATKTH